MISYTAACRIVEREMNLSYERSGLERIRRLRVFEEFTREAAWGWVIYYGDSYADFPETAESVYPPCLVDRNRGTLFATGKSWVLEKYIGDFEMQLLAGVGQDGR